MSLCVLQTGGWSLGVYQTQLPYTSKSYTVSAIHKQPNVINFYGIGDFELKVYGDLNVIAPLLLIKPG